MSSNTAATAATPESDQHFRAGFFALNDMRLSGEMTDVVITVGKEDKQASLSQVTLSLGPSKQKGRRKNVASLRHPQCYLEVLKRPRKLVYG
jgi:hypothetical protein